MRVTLQVESVPLRADVETWATMTVQNLGADPVLWLDSCEIPVRLGVRFGGAWIGGAPQLGVAGEFKALALRGEGSGASQLMSAFTAEQRVGRTTGCSDTGITLVLAPGERLTQRAVWMPPDHSPLPDGPVTLEAAFPFSGRGREAELDPLAAKLESWLVSSEPWPWLTPAQAVDAALADPAFFAWLLEVPSRTWINAQLHLDTEKGIWEVGLFRDEPGSVWAKIIKIDATTGQVIPEPILNERPPPKLHQ